MFIFISLILVTLMDGQERTEGDTDYAFDVPYDDVFIMNVIKGVQQTLVLTWLDDFTKVLPFLSMAGSLDHLIRHVQRHSEVAMSRVTIKRRSSSLTQAISRISSVITVQAIRRQRSRILHPLLQLRWVFILFFMWGVAILSVHLRAHHVSFQASMSTRVGCKSSSQPWFATQFTCTILEINCYRQGISDSAHEIDIALRRVNPDGLNSLIISHCPALSIPPRIQELPYLDALEINNASLLKWGEDAKVTHSTMPALQMLAFVRVNMTALPDAILTSDLSHRLRDLTISESNLTTLPPDLAIKWRRLFDLFIERTRVEVIAPTLAISSPMRLSLMGNQIHELPDDLFVHSQFSVLSVAKNPITKWPETIGNLDYLTMLLLDYTEIEELPSWLLDEGQHRGKTGKIITVSAGGSAYCRAKSALPSFSAVDESNTGLRVEYRVKPEEEYEAYPLSYNTRHRPV